MPSCVVNPIEHTHVATAVLPAAGPVNLPTGMSRAPTGYLSNLKPVTWNQHQLAYLQQMSSEASGTPAPGLTGKHTAGHELSGPGFVDKGSDYLQELCLAQSFYLKSSLEKPTPSLPVNGRPAPQAYPNGH